MIAKRRNGKILLVVYSSIFHELEINMFKVDKYGRSWTLKIDPETDLPCYSCETNYVFLDSYLESQVKYLS